MKARQILVTGATGYVGGRLVPTLLERGERVRCLARDPRRLEGRSWLDDVDVAQGDVLDEDALARALEGIDTAYYLIHSMRGGDDFRERDARAARLFGQACRRAGVTQIVYLGGLADESADLSPHLRSRLETGRVLRQAGVPVTEFRAGVIVGSGSLSFEMVRYLTERLPVMICPKWVFTKTQPIAIRDVLRYLVAALDHPEAMGKTVEIGGRDVLTYGEMMLGYAEARGLSRRLIPVPVLTPRLSSYWLHMVTPVPASIGKPLILGLRNESIVRDSSALRLFPGIAPVDYGSAVRRSLRRLRAGEVESAWTDSVVSSLGARQPAVLTTHEGMILEVRQHRVEADANSTFRAFCRLGGSRGWPSMNWAWQLRGTLDRILGGVGMRRGRRHPEQVRTGDAIDFWRVEAVEPDRLLRLRAEMKLPGRAWLQFEAKPEADGSTTLRQIAYFAPKGLFGLVYWYSLYPFHRIIFGRMVQRLAEDAEEIAAREEPRDEAPEAAREAVAASH